MMIRIKNLALFAIAVIAVFSCTASAAKVSFTYISDEVGMSSACSYYQIRMGDANVITFATDIAGLNLTQIQEVKGSLTSLSLDVKMNRTVSRVVEIKGNCTRDEDLGNGTVTVTYPCVKNTTTVYDVTYPYVRVLTSTGFSNATGKKRPNLQVGSINLTDVAGLWRTVQDGIPIELRVCGSYTPIVNSSGIYVSIDHIPAIGSTEYSKFSWWNASWSKKSEINITSAENVTNYQVKVNMSRDSDMSSDCNEFRVLNSSETGEYPFWLETCTNTTITFWVKGNWTTANGTQAYLYYRNSTAVSNASNSTNTFVDVISDLAGFWSFDETSGTTAYDSSANKNNMTLTRAAFGSGKYGNGLNFTADNGTATTTSETGLSITGNVTICAWVYQNTTGGDDYHAIVSKGFSAEYDVFLTRSNHRLGIYRNTTFSYAINFSTPANTWAYWCVASGSVEILYYKDGERRAIDTGRTGSANSYHVMVGARPDDPTVMSLQGSREDEVVIFSKLISSDTTHSNLANYRGYGSAGSLLLYNGSGIVTASSGVITSNGPQFNNASYFRASSSSGSSSYCGSNIAKYSAGTDTLTGNLTVYNQSISHKLVVRSIRNSNSMVVKIGSSTIGTISSTSGTTCNGNNWVINEFDVGSGNFTSDSVTVTIEPSGTDNNYVDYVGIYVPTNQTLFGKSWGALGIVSITSTQALTNVNRSGTILYNRTGSLFYDMLDVQASNGTQNLTYYASSSSGISNASYLIQIDSTAPNMSNISSAPTVLINYNESTETITGYINISDPNLHSVTCWLNASSQTCYNTGSAYNFTATVSDSGIYKLMFISNDTLGNIDNITLDVNVSKITAAYNAWTNSSQNHYYIPHNSSHLENAVWYYNAWFGLNFTSYANATFDFNETICQLIQIENITAVNLSNTTIALLADTYTVCYNVTYNLSNATQIQNYLGYLTATNVSSYWQNDATDVQKRYFRIGSNFSFNETLSTLMTFYLPMSFDPYNYHSEIWQCDVPSPTVRYDCDGTWSKLAQGSGLITDYMTLSSALDGADDLYFVDVMSGGQIAQQPGGGGVVGGGTSISGNVSATKQALGLPDLGKILLTPIAGFWWLSPLTIGILFAAIYFMRTGLTRTVVRR